MEVSRATAANLPLHWTSGRPLALRAQLPVAAPGRILNETYQSLGIFAERHANATSHRLGFGPIAVAQRIQDIIGDGSQRESRLQELRNDVAPKLKKDCSKLIGYAFPSESYRTQIEAFKGIVTLTTRFPGLRHIFLACKHLQDIEILSANVISELWKRQDDVSGMEDLVFFLQFAAACLVDKDIAPLMEGSSRDMLWNVESAPEGLSVVERLLVASDCEGTSDFSRLISIRYLGGLLECPSFWGQTGSMFEAIVKKILLGTSTILKDLGVDSLEIDDASEVTSDTEGVDILCESILLGVQNLKTPDLPAQNLSPQYWYPGISEIARLLRHPRAEYLLPRSWARSRTEEMKLLVPMAYALREVDTLVLPVNVASDARSIRPRRTRLRRFWRVLSGRSDNIPFPADNNPELGDVVSPSSQDPGTACSPVDATDSEAAQVAPPPRTASPIIPEVEVDTHPAELETNRGDESPEYHDPLARTPPTDGPERSPPLPASIGARAEMDNHESSEWIDDPLAGSLVAHLTEQPRSALLFSRTDHLGTTSDSAVTNAIPVHNPSSLATDLLLAQVSEALAAQQELFNKLPASAYHDATAVAGARVGALSMLLNSGPRTSPGDVGTTLGRDHTGNSFSNHDDGALNPISFTTPVVDVLPPSDSSAHPSSPRTTRRQMIRNEMSQSLRNNLLWHRHLTNKEVRPVVRSSVQLGSPQGSRLDN